MVPSYLVFCVTQAQTSVLTQANNTKKLHYQRLEYDIILFEKPVFTLKVLNKVDNNKYKMKQPNSNAIYLQILAICNT